MVTRLETHTVRPVVCSKTVMVGLVTHAIMWRHRREWVPQVPGVSHALHSAALMLERTRLPNDV